MFPDNIESPIERTAHRLTLQVHVDQTPSSNLIHGCEMKRNNKETKCFYTDLLEDLEHKPHFIYIGYTNARKFNAAFYAALVFGSIPVIGGFDFKSLPLSDLISWNSAVVRVPTNRIENMLDYLQQFDNDQVLEMKRRGQQFFSKNYFGDSKTLIRSTLSAVRYRMQVSAPFERIEETRLARSSIWPVNYTPREPVNTQNPWMSLQNANFVFNSDPTFLDSYSPYDRLWQSNERTMSPRALNSHLESAKSGMNYASSLSGNVPDEEFTIVLMAYKRDKQVRHVLKKLDGIRFLRQIIVLWVDKERKPPPSEFWPQLHVPVHFVLAENRSLNLRFLPFDLIETEAVFSMDDDFEADNELIEFSFRYLLSLVWRENRDVLVGPNERLGYTDPLTKQGVYKSETECHYNLILTSGAFLHRNYLKAYWTSQPEAVREWVDQKTNCEDVAMNFLVSHLGTFVEKGLSKRPEHLKDRARCVQVFEEIYGYNPLLLSEYRADSVHYQHERQYQCFKGT
ncbi:Exostosin and EXTL2 domain containing protein [Aphelenchoides bicaudatus]|nr:Exostosin and EXTL2 domain containing protein [Aphelenchoides bicaudatus]